MDSVFETLLEMIKKYSSAHLENISKTQSFSHLPKKKR
jgi:hypothetical protein